jgi:hypothetical protein
MGWEEDLPPGYRLREVADLLVVLRPDGSEVAAFSTLGADPMEVIARRVFDPDLDRVASKGEGFFRLGSETIR